MRKQAVEGGKCLFKKVECPNARTKFEKEEIKIKAIMELKGQFKLNELLTIANIPKSTYYYWIRKLNSPDKYKQIKKEMRQIVHENKGRYGYRRVTSVLKSKGYVINHKTVRKLMKQLGLTCVVHLKKYRSYKGQVGKIAKNLLKRNFTANKPNEKWLTDVTEFHLLGEKIYLSPILDVFNGEIISY